MSSESRLEEGLIQVHRETRMVVPWLLTVHLTSNRDTNTYIFSYTLKKIGKFCLHQSIKKKKKKRTNEMTWYFLNYSEIMHLLLYRKMYLNIQYVCDFHVSN